MRLTEGGPLETAREEASLGFLPKYWLLPAPTLPRAHSPLSPPGICLPSWLSLLLLTRLFSLDNDIVRGLEQVTAALACEGQIGKVRAGPRGAKT